uniref:Uncharacterized protein n=1 Tax=viral metagenome TaxID=1070528 RepID=A0A6C0C6K7_9ZZZZ
MYEIRKKILIIMKWLIFVMSRVSTIQSLNIALNGSILVRSKSDQCKSLDIE